MSNDLRAARPVDALAIRARGFTLIELMVVTAVIAILALLGYPSYQRYMQRANRSIAQSYMVEAAGRQQQWMLDTRAYASSLAELQRPVPEKVTGRYTVTLDTQAGPPPGFTITAAPVGAQADDSCGQLRIDQNGVRSPAGCW